MNVTDIRAYVNAQKLAMKVSIGEAVTELGAKIVDRTPTDYGDLRANWQAANGQRVESVIDAQDVEGSRTKSKIAAIAKKCAGKVFYLSNNLPYSQYVEFGGYPDVVEKGSYVPTGHTRWYITGPAWFKFSENRFSKRAPQGMVGVSVTEFDKMLKSAVEKNRVK